MARVPGISAGPPLTLCCWSKCRIQDRGRARRWRIRRAVHVRRGRRPVLQARYPRWAPAIADDAWIRHEDRQRLIDHYRRFRHLAVDQALLFKNYSELSGRRWISILTLPAPARRSARRSRAALPASRTGTGQDPQRRSQQLSRPPASSPARSEAHFVTASSTSESKPPAYAAEWQAV